MTCLFKDTLPKLYGEVHDALVALKRDDVLEQLPDLTLQEYQGDRDAFYVYVGGTRGLNIVEHNVIGLRYDYSIPLSIRHSIVNIDLDNFGRVRGIEPIGRADVYKRLANRIPRRLR